MNQRINTYILPLYQHIVEIIKSIRLIKIPWQMKLLKNGKWISNNRICKKDVDSWEYLNNQLTVNLGQAIKLKVANPNLHFQEDYSIKEFQEITGELIIFGLSPYNDYHLFEIINNAALENVYSFITMIQSANE